MSTEISLCYSQSWKSNYHNGSAFLLQDTLGKCVGKRRLTIQESVCQRENVFLRKPSPQVSLSHDSLNTYTIRFCEPIICGFYSFLLGVPTVFMTLAVMKHSRLPEYDNAVEIALFLSLSTVFRYRSTLQLKDELVI